MTMQLKLLTPEALQQVLSNVEDLHAERCTNPKGVPLRGQLPQEWLTSQAKHDGFSMYVDDQVVGYGFVLSPNPYSLTTELLLTMVPTENILSNTGEALHLLAQFGMRYRRIRKISCRVAVTKPWFLEAAESMGFRREAVYDDACFCHGSYVDMVRLALFRKDW